LPTDGRVFVVEDLMIVQQKLIPQKPRHLPGFFFAGKKSKISKVMQKRSSQPAAAG
jgi:hypothetical protein